MISALGLKNKIVEALHNATYEDNPQMLFARAVEDYFRDNLRIEGQYVGMLSAGVSDPLSGIYIVGVQDVSVNENALLSAAKSSAGFSQWYMILQYFLKNIRMTTNIQQVLVAQSFLAPFSLLYSSTPNISEMTDFSSIMETIADKLMGDILQDPPFNSPIPTISTTGGVGTFTMMRYV